MQVINYSQNGYDYREIRFNSYTRLHELELEYKKRGKKTWMMLFDCSKNLWSLTIVMAEGKDIEEEN